MSRTAFSFVHCADLHLDSPFEGVNAIDPNVAQVMREATFGAFENVVSMAIDEKVDFLIVAGDVYDGADRSLRAQLRFRDALTRATEADIECIVVHGNHDPLDGWEADLAMPDGVHRFGGSEVEMVPIERDRREIARVYGVSYPVREVRQNLVSQFKREEGVPFAIGVLHCNVGGNSDHDNYAPCSLEDLRASGMDYWALGHIHTKSVLCENNPCVIYPGNTQGRSVRETGPRGCYLIRVDETANIRPTFFETHEVRWFHDDSTVVNINELQSIDELLNALTEVLESSREQSGGRPAIARLRIVGRGDLHTDLRRNETERDLLSQLRDSESGRQDFVWVESVRISTQPIIDIDQRRKVEDFVGDYLRAAQAIREDCELQSTIYELLKKRPEFAKISHHLDALTTDEWATILSDAEVMGFDYLLGDEI